MERVAGLVGLQGSMVHAASRPRRPVRAEGVDGLLITLELQGPLMEGGFAVGFDGRDSGRGAMHGAVM